MRLANVTLGYTLPNNVFGENSPVSRLRIYVSGQNLLTVTDYSGYDPEISSGNGDFLFSRGVDRGQYPVPRTILFGINLGF